MKKHFFDRSGKSYSSRYLPRCGQAPHVRLPYLCPPYFFLIRDRLDRIQGIIIDDEYPGWHFMIKNILLQHIRTIKPDFDKQIIVTQCIGKKSSAHHTAYATYTKKRESDMMLRYQDIARFVLK